MKKLNMSIILPVLFIVVISLSAFNLAHSHGEFAANCSSYGCPKKVDNWVLIIGFTTLIGLVYNSAKK